MQSEEIIRVLGDNQEDIIRWNSAQPNENHILDTLFYITNNYRKKFCCKILLKDNFSKEYTEGKALLQKNPTFLISADKSIPNSDFEAVRDFKNIFNINEEEQKVVVEKFKKGKKTENMIMDFATIKKINQNFEDTLLKFMNNAENSSLNEEKDMIEFQTKSNFKVAGKDGKSQYTFMQLAEKKQIDYAAVSQKGYTAEEIAEHKTEDSTWMIINDKVYDITIYKKYHPGGLDKIMMGAGKDGTSLIFKYHPWVNVHNILEKYQVGYVIKKK